MLEPNRKNVRAIRPPTALELTAWRRWFPRKDCTALVGRFFAHGGYICMPGGAGVLEDQPAPSSLSVSMQGARMSEHPPSPNGPDDGGHAA